MTSQSPTKFVCKQSFAEGPDSHLCASADAVYADGSKRHASTRVADIPGVSVTDGDIDPDVVTIDFVALAADVQELRIRVYPFRQHHTFAGADYAFRITVAIHVNSERSEILEYQPQERVFEGVDLIVFKKQKDGQWTRELVAGATLIEAGAA